MTQNVTISEDNPHGGGNTCGQSATEWQATAGRSVNSIGSSAYLCREVKVGVFEHLRTLCMRGMGRSSGIYRRTGKAQNFG